MKYPKEWPGFRWRGRICEGVDFLECFGVEMRLPEEEKPTNLTWPYCLDAAEAVPLTPAARDMLAIARCRRG